MEKQKGKKQNAVVAFKAAVALVVLAVSGAAIAASTSTTFQVTANVNANCQIDSASTLAFGPYDPSSGAALDGSSAIVLRCTRTTPYTLTLNAGTTVGGSLAARLMTNGTDTLQYNLFTTAARTTIWGDGSGGTGTVAGTGAGMGVPNQNTHNVFGRIPNQPTAAPGNYSDLITVTLAF